MKIQNMLPKFSHTSLSYAAGLLTSIIGVLVLIGWQFDITILKTFSLGAVTMKPNTAACFLLAGLALIFLQRSHFFANSIVRFLALVIMLVGILSLFQNFFGWDIGFDEILFREPEGTIGTLHPGLMAPNTALNFLLLGFAFFLLTFKRFQSGFLVEFTLVFPLFLSIFGLIGSLTGLVELAGLVVYTKLVVHTTGTFIILSVGMLLTSAERQHSSITIEQKLFSGLTIVCAIVIFISQLSFSGINSLLGASKWIKHTQQVQLQLTEVLSQAVDAETSARGFVIIGEESYAEPLHKISVTLPNLFKNLRMLTSDNPRQQETLTLLEHLVNERIEFSERLYQTRRSQGLERAISLFATGMGKIITDSIRVLVAKMIAEEDRLMLVRISNEKDYSNQIQKIIYLSLAIQMLLLAFIFIIVKREMSGRRKAEESLSQLNEELEARVKERTEALQKSEEQNRLMIDGVSDYAILMLDVSGHVKNWNNGGERINGYHANEIIGQHFSRFYTIEDIQFDKPAMDLEAAVTKGRFENESWRVRKDGSRFWASMIITALHDTDGKLLGFSKITRDITERKKAEEALQLLNTQLEVSNKELESFSYSVSHDLRAPLRHIDGFIELLKKKIIETADDSVKRYLNIISQASKKLSCLIDELLSYSRTGRTKLIPKEVGLNELVKEVITELTPQMENRKINWQIDQLPRIQADYNLIKLVYQNLIGNSIKFTMHKEEAVVLLTAKEEEGRYILTIKDNGAGFDMAFSERLFGVFQRLHREDEFEGTGIGLANVRRIVQMHSGDIWAKGKVNEGAEFSFTIPKAIGSSKEK